MIHLKNSPVVFGAAELLKTNSSDKSNALSLVQTITISVSSFLKASGKSLYEACLTTITRLSSSSWLTLGIGACIFLVTYVLYKFLGAEDHKPIKQVNYAYMLPISAEEMSCISARPIDNLSKAMSSDCLQKEQKEKISFWIDDLQKEHKARALLRPDLFAAHNPAEMHDAGKLASLLSIELNALATWNPCGDLLSIPDYKIRLVSENNETKVRIVPEENPYGCLCVPFSDLSSEQLVNLSQKISSFVLERVSEIGLHRAA